MALPVHNGETFLEQSVMSVLGQTFDDFELLVIDDGSTDGTRDVLAGIDDRRLRVIRQPNRGVAHALNRAIDEARGPIVARQDADDVSDPHRFELQYERLVGADSIGAVGCSIRMVDERSSAMGTWHVLLGAGEIRHEMLIACPLAHGSVMYRVDVVRAAGGYRGAWWPAEDYDLWIRLALVCDIENLAELLYTYRVHSSSTSADNADLQVDKTRAVRDRAWSKAGRYVGSSRFELSKYRGIESGDIRIARILASVAEVSRRSVADRKFALAARSIWQIAQEPLTYRHAVQRAYGSTRSRLAQRRAA